MRWSESESRSVVSNPSWPHGLYSPWNSPGQHTGVGSLSLLQGIFPTQGSNSGLLHCGQILYQLSHKGSPRMLEWVAYSFSSGSSQTQESNRCLLHCTQILYQLSYQGYALPNVDCILMCPFCFLGSYWWCRACTLPDRRIQNSYLWCLFMNWGLKMLLYIFLLLMKIKVSSDI